LELHINLPLYTSTLNGPICPYICSLTTRSGYFIRFKIYNTHSYCVHTARKVFMIQYAKYIYIYVVLPHGQNILRGPVRIILIWRQTTWPGEFALVLFHHLHVHKDGDIFPVCFHTQGTVPALIIKVYRKATLSLSIYLQFRCSSHVTAVV
jgi:hypothetical protein